MGEMSNNKRLEDLAMRDFKHKLEIYIFKEIIDGKDVSKFNFEEFLEFNRDINNAIIDQYLYSLQMDAKMKDEEGNVVDLKINDIPVTDIDAKYKEYHKENIILKYGKKYTNYFKSKFSSQDLDELLQKSMSPVDSLGKKSLQCHYCGITENIISEIIIKTKENTSTLNRFFTKRFFYGRGKTMEIDQIDPNKGYEKDNLVVACYWCNNAKTDEFCYCEFKEKIAPAIHRIWEKRFEIKLPKPPKAIKIIRMKNRR